MISMFDFAKNSVWFSEYQQKWMFLNKPFRRKGQAEKACYEEFKRRRRLGLSMLVETKFVM